MIVHVIWYKRNSENCSTYFLYNCAVAIVQFSTIWWKRTKKKGPNSWQTPKHLSHVVELPCNQLWACLKVLCQRKWRLTIFSENWIVFWYIPNFQTNPTIIPFHLPCIPIRFLVGLPPCFFWYHHLANKAHKTLPLTNSSWSY